MNYHYKLLQCALRIERLASHLAENRKGCQQCCVEVSLAANPAKEHDNHATGSAVTVRLILSPDPLAGQPDLVLTPVYAARMLGRSDRQVFRYRTEGKLDYVEDDGEGRSGYWLSQVRRQYFDLWGKWPQ